jgi:hypothetical protein
MLKSFLKVGSALLLTLFATTDSWSQDKTTPGPRNPGQPTAQIAPGTTVVADLPKAQCREGWNPTLRWTREQFEELCAKAKAPR